MTTDTKVQISFQDRSVRPDFFNKFLYGNFFSDLGSYGGGGTKKNNKKALKMTS